MRHRGVAQWLARFVRDEEVGGSNPLTPTNLMSGNRNTSIRLSLISPPNIGPLNFQQSLRINGTFGRGVRPSSLSQKWGGVT